MSEAASTNGRNAVIRWIAGLASTLFILWASFITVQVMEIKTDLASVMTTVDDISEDIDDHVSPDPHNHMSGPERSNNRGEY